MYSLVEEFELGGSRVQARIMPVTDASDSFVRDWLDLESRAVEGNAFLSPHFVLPACRLLDPNKRVFLLAIVRSQDSGNRLIGLGVFLIRQPRLRFPLPHLAAYRSVHSFLTGMLLDKDDMLLALDGIATFLSSPRVPWCGVEFMGRAAEAAIDRIETIEGSSARARWSEYYCHRRAIFVPSNGLQAYDAVLHAGEFGKELRRKRRRLDEQGKVEWRLLSGEEVTDESIETFLRLEDQGWKHESCKSLQMRPGHADFFREMTKRFRAEGRAFFTELRVDDKVIASTSNYVSGNVGFAFKVGWDTAFASMSPGLLNELEMLRCEHDRLSSLAFVDSGAQEGSFIERFWRDSRSVSSGVFVAGRLASAIVPALTFARHCKRYVMLR